MSDRGPDVAATTGEQTLDYALLPARIAELADALDRHPDPAVASTAGELLDWIDAFHSHGIRALVAMVREWRGELFLEHASADPVVGLLLAGYDCAVAASPADTSPAVGAASPNAVPVHLGRRTAP